MSIESDIPAMLLATYSTQLACGGQNVDAIG
jgi:hypothetical protein